MLIIMGFPSFLLTMNLLFLKRISFVKLSVCEIIFLGLCLCSCLRKRKKKSESVIKQNLDKQRLAKQNKETLSIKLE